jgi:hypothetical protein
MSRLIRKLNVGSIKDGFYWLLGNTQSIDGIKRVISNIVQKENSKQEKLWEIWVSHQDEDGHTVHHLWKEHLKGNESVTIEYDIND